MRENSREAPSTAPGTSQIFNKWVVTNCSVHVHHRQAGWLWRWTVGTNLPIEANWVQVCRGLGGGLSNVNPRAVGCMTLAFLSFPRMLVSILCASKLWPHLPLPTPSHIPAHSTWMYTHAAHTGVCANRYPMPENPWVNFRPPAGVVLGLADPAQWLQ